MAVLKLHDLAQIQLGQRLFAVFEFARRMRLRRKHVFFLFFIRLLSSLILHKQVGVLKIHSGSVGLPMSCTHLQIGESQFLWAQGELIWDLIVVSKRSYLVVVHSYLAVVLGLILLFPLVLARPLVAESSL